MRSIFLNFLYTPFSRGRTYGVEASLDILGLFGDAVAKHPWARRREARLWFKRQLDGPCKEDIEEFVNHDDMYCLFMRTLVRS